MTMILPS